MYGLKKNIILIIMDFSATFCSLRIAVGICWTIHSLIKYNIKAIMSSNPKSVLPNADMLCCTFVIRRLDLGALATKRAHRIVSTFKNCPLRSEPKIIIPKALVSRGIFTNPQQTWRAPKISLKNNNLIINFQNVNEKNWRHRFWQITYLVSFWCVGLTCTQRIVLMHAF